jgi:glycosyltransferase involved in cell wall biosynthesis
LAVLLITAMPEIIKEMVDDLNKFTSVSIVIPALNETFLLRQTFEIILSTCNKTDIKEIVIVLCDRSTTDCIKTAEQLKKDYNSYPVKIYFQVKPFIGAAYQEVFDFSEGSHIIMAAADMDMDPYAISKFIEKSKVSPDSIILASRWIPGGNFHGYNKIKLVLNYIFQKMLNVIFFTTLTDMTYGFRLYPAKLMKSIVWEESKHPFFLETCLKPLKLGSKFIEVPAVWNVRTEGTSAISLWKCFKYIKTVFHIRFMKKSEILKC